MGLTGLIGPLGPICPVRSIGPGPFRLRRFLAAVLLLTSPMRLLAGGGPENLFLVVNSRSDASLSVANQYVALRHISPGNVLHLDWDGGAEAVDIDTFRQRILGPAIEAIAGRGLTNQIDYLIYSSDFPYRVDFAADMPPQLRKQSGLSGSLTSLTYLYQAVLARSGQYVSLTANHYMRLAETPGDTPASHGFRSWYGWGPKGELLESGGERYLLSTMLAATSGRGNTLDETTDYLRRSAAADGTLPKGTIYYTRTGDVRSTTRQPGFEAAVKALTALGVAAEIVDGSAPLRKSDVQGAMLGAADIPWGPTGSTIRPGAIIDNLTSYGGVLSAGAGQTPLTEFLRYGAAGASGTVVEPYAIPNKFPAPAIQVHYARGCSLAEAFYQSVWGPYQLLVVGDPLCRPWARIPVVEVSGVENGATVRGTLELKPSAKVAEGHTVDRFELFVEGLRVARCNAGESLKLDTTQLPDGACDLRIVALEAGPIETQGELELKVTVANSAAKLDWGPTAWEASAGGPLKIRAHADKAEWIAIFHDAQLLGRISGAEGELPLDTKSLGSGPVRLRAVAKLATTPPSYVVGRTLSVPIKPVGK